MKMKKFIYSILCIAFFSAVAISVSSCGDDAVEDINKEENNDGNNDGNNDDTNNSFKLIGKYEVEGAENLAYIEFKANASAIGYDEFGESEELPYKYNEETKKLTIFDPEEGEMSLWLEFLSNDRIVGWTKENHTESTEHFIFKRLEFDITFAPIIGTWRIYDNNSDVYFEQISIGCKGGFIWKEYDEWENEIDYGSYTYEDNILTWYTSDGYVEGKWHVLEITGTKMLTTWIKSSGGEGEIEEWTKIPHRNQQ